MRAQSSPTLCNPMDDGRAPPSPGFPRQEYRSRLPFASPRDLPKPGIEPEFSAVVADSISLSHLESP